MNASTAVVLADVPRRATRRLSSYPVVPLTIIGLLVVIALAADVLAPHNPEVGALGMLFGARVSLVVGFTAVIVAGLLGVALGITAGYLGGWVDEVIMRLTDTWLALPALTFAIFLAAVMGPSEMNIIIVLACVYWTRYARVIRGEVLSLKEREFVRLAIIAGCSRLTIMRRHILPNVLNSAIVLATLMLGVVVVTEAALSFLGVGVPPPKPAWGLMLADGKRGLMAGYWWLTVLPGLCIMFLVLAANLLGDWLRVKLDPQLRQL
jgi:peptide/nickel transport system permease protein